MTMRCTDCGKHMTRILETRQQDDGSVKRRRECLSCGSRFNTAEKPADKEDAA